MKLLWRGALALWLAGVAGCAWFMPTTEGELLSRQALAELPVWRFEGRLALRARGDAWTANLIWQHENGWDRLTLSGPFAQRAATIVSGKGRIIIATSEGESESTDDPETLLQQRLGFSVPLAALRYWVLGLPAPQSSLAETYQGEELEILQQNGWALRYERYSRVGGWLLPGKLSAEGRGVQLKLIVDHWEM